MRRVASPLLTARDVEEPSPPTANPVSHKVHGQLGLPDMGGTFPLSKAVLTIQPLLGTLTGGTSGRRIAGACPSERPLVRQTGFPKTPL